MGVFTFELSSPGTSEEENYLGGKEDFESATIEHLDGATYAHRKTGPEQNNTKQQNNKAVPNLPFI
jgi:hypothetical protein